jgi:hypothetical protein
MPSFAWTTVLLGPPTRTGAVVPFTLGGHGTRRAPGRCGFACPPNGSPRRRGAVVPHRAPGGRGGLPARRRPGEPAPLRRPLGGVRRPGQPHGGSHASRRRRCVRRLRAHPDDDVRAAVPCRPPGRARAAAVRGRRPGRSASAAGTRLPAVAGPPRPEDPRVCGDDSRERERTGTRTEDPRVCGDDRTLLSSTPAPTGRPPRVRGRLSWGVARGRAGRKTPACAGTTNQRDLTMCVIREDPRVCGDGRDAGGCRPHAQGRPPRVRGRHERSTREPAPSPRRSRGPRCSTRKSSRSIDSFGTGRPDWTPTAR